jgi:hypothetical protein
MTANDKQSSLPAPVSLTLEEAMQVAGGSTAAHFVLEHIIIGRPAFERLNPVQVPVFQVGGV